MAGTSKAMTRTGDDNMPSLAELKVTDFEPLSGGVFRLRTDAQDIELTLMHVGHLGDSGREGGAFSLLFRSAKGPFLPQAIYPIAHPALGTLEIFIVPIGPVDGGNGYEAIFT
jgi:Domain of unknown function (DUF6916)